MWAKQNTLRISHCCGGKVWKRSKREGWEGKEFFFIPTHCYSHIYVLIPDWLVTQERNPKLN
jgi:hypothetical protein